MLGMLSRTKPAALWFRQSHSVCEASRKERLRVSVTEESKQSQVQSERREGWKGVRKIKMRENKNKTGGL